MSLPDRLILERFRSFAGRTSLPLKPITLVYGANNAGKSALLRGLALFGASVDGPGTAPLVYPKRAFPRPNFRELAWQGDAGNYSWKIGLEWENCPLRQALFTLDGPSDRPPFIKRLDLQGDGQTLSFHSNQDDVLVHPTDQEILPFDGLIPRGERLGELRRQLGELRGKFRWLAALRRPVPNTLEAGAATNRSHFGDGEEAAALLIEDKDLRTGVDAFYQGLTPARSLSLHETPVGHWLSLNPLTQPTWQIHINDIGEGMAQVLPVLIEAEITAREGGILAVEEPESHLHPNAQRRLATYLCDRARRPTGPRFILETHSRIFLLAVQLEVANGFPADLVRVVWVDQETSGRSRLTEIRLRDNGQLGDGWPSTALGDDLSLARELTKMGRSRPERS